MYYAAAVYLLYLVYGLVADIKNGGSENVAASIVAAVFFTFAAAAIALYARRKSKAEAREKQKEAEDGCAADDTREPEAAGGDSSSLPDGENESRDV